MSTLAGILIAAASAAVGMAFGRWAFEMGLTINADSPGRTPHKLGRDFYYVVPEDEYVRVWCQGKRYGE